MMKRRDALKVLAAGSIAACTPRTQAPAATGNTTDQAAPAPSLSAPQEPNPIRDTFALGFQWRTVDPFLYCVHHHDAYPEGDAQFGPTVSLAGRDIGRDFAGKDGWNMYHGRHVPGFPKHPHRGFETVTVVREGLLDHADSLGAAARFGQGDVQWLTAGAGIQHSEMFPLLNQDEPNPVELFQIWVNLPARRKFAPPNFSMFWHEDIPRIISGAPGSQATVTVIAGPLNAVDALPPPPDSWASEPDSDFAIWTIQLDPNARWVIPAASAQARRHLYYFAGSDLAIGGRRVNDYHGFELTPTQETHLENQGDGPIELIMLQARPIAEPVARYGPFVMNTEDELRQAYADYRRSQFGGWGWDRTDPVHDREGRFARQPDGKIERPKPA